MSGALELFPLVWGEDSRRSAPSYTGGASIQSIASGGRVGNNLANGQKSGRGGSFSRARPSDPPSLHC